jgi:hypothetical protein
VNPTLLIAAVLGFLAIIALMVIGAARTTQDCREWLWERQQADREAQAVDLEALYAVPAREPERSLR